LVSEGGKDDRRRSTISDAEHTSRRRCIAGKRAVQDDDFAFRVGIDRCTVLTRRIFCERAPRDRDATAHDCQRSTEGSPVPLEGALVDTDDRASVWIDGKAGDRSTDSSKIVPEDASRHEHGGCGLSPNRAAARPRREALELTLDDFERRVPDMDSGVLVAAQRQPLDPHGERTADRHQTHRGEAGPLDRAAPGESQVTAPVDQERVRQCHGS
jgi:hypothetical protein